jgi:hypothetical protein
MEVKIGGGHGLEPIYIKTPLPSPKNVWGESPNPQEWGITETLATLPQTRPYQVLSF